MHFWCISFLGNRKVFNFFYVTLLGQIKLQEFLFYLSTLLQELLEILNHIIIYLITVLVFYHTMYVY